MIDKGFPALPERFKFYGQLETQQAEFDKTLRCEWLRAIRPEFAPELEAVLAKMPVLDVDFVERRTPCAIGGADEIEIGYSMSAKGGGGGEGPFFIFNVSLFGDSSPFMYDDDLDNGYDIEIYDVIVGTEMPPFIVCSQAIEKITIGDYLSALKESGKEPRYLNDDECAALSQAFRRQEPDFYETLSGDIGGPFTHYF